LHNYKLRKLWVEAKNGSKPFPFPVRMLSARMQKLTGMDAEKNLLQCISDADAAGEKQLAAIARLSLAGAYLRNEEMRAMPLFEEALDTFETTNPDEGNKLRQRAREWRAPQWDVSPDVWVADATSSIGMLQQARGDAGKAIECFEKELSLAEESGDGQTSYDALRNIGNAHIFCGRCLEAVPYLERALELAEKINDGNSPERLSHALMDLANAHCFMGRNKEAMALYERRLTISKKTGDERGISACISNMALIYAKQEKYKLAMASYQKRLEISKKWNDVPGIVFSTGAIGEMLFALGYCDKAAEAAKSQILLAEKSGVQRYGFYGKNLLADIDVALGDYAAAKQLIDEMLQHYEEKDIAGGKSSTLASLAYMHNCMKEHGKALEAIEKAIEIDRTSGLQGQLCANLYAKAEILFKQGKLMEAERANTEAIGIAIRNEDKRIKFSCLVMGAKIIHHYAKRDGIGQLSILFRAISETDSNEIKEQKKALLHYELFRITKEEENRKEALKLYTVLYERSKIVEYGEKINELSAQS